jgi:hypothetical protein
MHKDKTTNSEAIGDSSLLSNAFHTVAFALDIGMTGSELSRIWQVG